MVGMPDEEEGENGMNDKKLWKNFTFLLLLVVFLRSRLVRVWRYLKMMTILIVSMFKSSLMSGEMKFGVSMAHILLAPLGWASMLLAIFVDGATVLCTFTVPIFMPGYPRPISFLKEPWKKGKRKEETFQWRNNNMECIGHTLDWTIYDQVSPLVVKELVTNLCRIGYGEF